ncbi:hypothetical protein [Streptomyces sp. NPDC047009]|uniref:hypothetical protein n=1 Tax=Streptomyces sp. NPDC047009 TaxID=3154496 RepID=UPI0033EF5A48
MISDVDVRAKVLACNFRGSPRQITVVVRGTLQESAWSQIRAKTAEGRTRLWSAAVAQLFVRRGNILSALGLFGTTETKEGAIQDPRPLMELLLGAEAGDAAAWTALVQRMAPALIHAPQPFITPGQGSEAGTGRKGVRRTPKSALAALTLAYTAGAPGVSRALLLAFAKAVLEHPDALRPPEVDDDTPLVCYGEQHWAESERTARAGPPATSPTRRGSTSSSPSTSAPRYRPRPEARPTRLPVRGTRRTPAPRPPRTARRLPTHATNWPSCAGSCRRGSNSSRGATRKRWTLPTP